MSGAAAVLGIMKAISILKPKINVLGVVCAAHNAIDGKAYFPGDIYKSYSGKTVEILNTDAEGRLALADGISYTIKHFKPTEIIDMATLTGSIISAIGDTMAGLFSNNDTVANKLFKCGEKTGERRGLILRLGKKIHRPVKTKGVSDLLIHKSRVFINPGGYQ